MAINVNTVYQTVLTILNKEQRGYMTPDEFNNVATQVQLEIFEKYFTLPTTDAYGKAVTLYRIGEVTYKNEVLVQRLQRNDFYTSEKSKLTKATKTFPTYLFENNYLFVRPTTIQSDIQIEYVRKPVDVIWGFTVGSVGQYVYNSAVYNSATQIGSQNFELDISEQTEVILRILMYSGIIIKDPQIVQAAAQQVQMDEINKKS